MLIPKVFPAISPVSRTFKPRLHHHVEIDLTHTQIGAETVNPSHAVFYPSYFFLSCYGEQRERTEKRERAEEKKIEERENIGQNERQREKKKKKKLK
jgi:hypothetical protein